MPIKESAGFLHLRGILFFAMLKFRALTAPNRDKLLIQKNFLQTAFYSAVTRDAS